MAATGGLFGSKRSKLTPEQLQELQSKIAQSFTGGSPESRYGYEHDPRKQSADALLEAGSATTPVAGLGGGIARGLSGIAGGYFGKKAQDKWADIDNDRSGVLKRIFGGKNPTSEMPTEIERPGLDQGALNDKIAAGLPPVDLGNHPPPVVGAPGANGANGVNGDGTPAVPPPVKPPVIAPPPVAPPPQVAGPPPGPPPVPPGAAGNPGAAPPDLANRPPVLGPGGGGMPGMPPPRTLGAAPGPGGPAAVAAALSGAPPGGPVPGAPPPNPTVAPSPLLGAQARVPSAATSVSQALAAEPASEDVTGSQLLEAAPKSSVYAGPFSTPGKPKVAPTATAPQPYTVDPDKQERLEQQGFAPRRDRVRAKNAGLFGGKDDVYGPWGAVYGFGTYGRPDKPLPNMTIGQVMDFGKKVLIPATAAEGIGMRNGKAIGTSAGGKYQITNETLQDYAPALFGDKWLTRQYDPQAQYKLGEAIFNDRKKGNLKETWTSLPDATPGAYANKTWAEVEPLIAAGESGGKGGGGASPASSTAGGMTENVPKAPQMAVAPLPAAPIRPTLPDKVNPATSARMELLQKLIPELQNSNLPGGIQMGLMREFYEKGLDTEEQNRQARDTEEAGYRGDLFKGDVSRYNQQLVNLSDAQIAQTARDDAFNKGLTGKEYDAHVAAEAARVAGLRDTAKAKIENDAKIEAARVKAAAFKPPPQLIKPYYQAVGKIENGTRVLNALAQRPKGVGAQNYINQALTQRTDPEGVNLRAEVSNYGGLLLLGRSGAAVPKEEWARAAPWVPTPNDTQAAIEAKMKVIMDEAQGEVDRIQGMVENGVYGYAPGGGGFAGVVAAGTQSPNWGPSMVVK